MKTLFIILPLLLLFSGCMLNSDYYLDDTTIINNTYFNVSTDTLNGIGTAFACINENGTIFRQNTTCVP